MSVISDPLQLRDAGVNDLRRAMGRFTTGVGLIMSETESGPHGATINSLTWISHKPPLILVSLTLESRMAEYIRHSAQYSVSILRSRQAKIASQFAKPGGARFKDLEVHRGESGLPIVPNALSVLECSVEREITAGDHVIFLGRVHYATYDEGEPLAFHSGRFGEFVDPNIEPDLWP